MAMTKGTTKGNAGAITNKYMKRGGTKKMGVGGSNGNIGGSPNANKGTVSPKMKGGGMYKRGGMKKGK